MRSASRYLVLVVLLNVLAACATTTPDDWPSGWEDMEIEAKWQITSEVYEELIEAHADGIEVHGYVLNVRWGGTPRKFVDRYYDDHRGTLSDALHAVRHRTRFTSRPTAASRGIDDLEAASWRKDWEVVQYKSTPTRIGAVWFRHESGACRLWDRSDNNTCFPNETVSAEMVLRGERSGHDAYAAMVEDHPGVVIDVDTPVLAVTDYRYRIEFQRDGDAVYEMSLDRLQTTERDGSERDPEYEAELEIIMSDYGEAELAELFRLVETLERRFEFEPSTRSKGGNEVPDARGLLR